MRSVPQASPFSPIAPLPQALDRAANKLSNSPPVEHPRFPDLEIEPFGLSCRDTAHLRFPRSRIFLVRNTSISISPASSLQRLAHAPEISGIHKTEIIRQAQTGRFQFPLASNECKATKDQLTASR